MEQDGMNDLEAMPPADEDPFRDQKIINEEYKIWKKNSPLLYDMMYARALEWPTLTMQWFPDKKAVPNTNYSQHRLLFATHTSNNITNSLLIASVDVPDLPTNKFANYDESRGDVGGPGHASKPFEWNVVQRIPVESEVNKARYQPQNPNIIAATCADGKIRIFDRTKHPSHPKDESTFQSEMILQGHEAEGFGLAWNPHREGYLATGTEDCTVRIWDTKGGFSKSDRTLKPTSTYKYHHATVNDIDHHARHNFWVATASDDLSWKVIDTREPPSAKPARDVQNAHTDAVNCIALQPNPDYDMLVATGSADKSIGLWDLRNTTQKIHSFEFHRSEVISLQWHPQSANLLASSSNDRRINIWDLGNVGKDQTPEEAEDGPPELAFMHGGFTNRISDFDWNKNDPWVMVATAEDNQVQIIRPAKSLVEPRKKKKQPRKETSD